MYDYVIVGGGIVGLSTALALSNRYPYAKIACIEKERGWAAHQTGRNSGVIHSGIYYKPGSMKAKLAVKGSRSMIAFSKEHGINHEVCGKVIVATEQGELPRMENLYERGLKNGLDIRKIGLEELHEIEPHVQAIGAIHVPATGIVNYKQVTQTIARLLEEKGAELLLDTAVVNIAEGKDEVVVETNRGTLHAKYFINCAGLHSDRLVKMANIHTDLRIVPFRGEYYELTAEKRHLVKHLIYPVPNPDFPFLGVHLTRMIDGTIHAGPNAVLSLKREGYHKTAFHLKDAVDVLTFQGFWRLAGANLKEGMMEMVRSFHKRSFVRSLQRLVPDITEEDVIPTHAGVRAQALLQDGKLVDDFFLIPGKRSIHVCNAPSPAATASLEIGKVIAAKVPKMENVIVS